jgi:acyl-CoA oxidase
MVLIRQSLGGAGYSAWSGIPFLMEDYSPEITFEGDNTVMAQQSFNYLRKLIKKLQKGPIKDQGYFEYLNEIKNLTTMKCNARDSHHFLILENVHTALKVNLAVQIARISEAIKANQAT